MRRVFIQHSRIGDVVMDVLQRRRELLDAGSFEGVRVIGPSTDSETLRVREFLFRNGIKPRILALGWSVSWVFGLSAPICGICGQIFFLFRR
jgi:hypothetical protein